MKKLSLSVPLAMLISITAIAEEGGGLPAIPSETTTNYLRTTESIAGLTFSMSEREGWVLSGVQFGIKDSRLMLARYYSMTPEGVVQYVDDSALADALVDDTTDLPLEVSSWIGETAYQIRGFTLGKGAKGLEGYSAYVDWVRVAGPDGKTEDFFRPRPDANPGVAQLCSSSHELVCAGLCTGACVVAGADPCDCNAVGFCFVDFEVFGCFDGPACSGAGGKCYVSGSGGSCGCFT
ncbi:MAG: hypothetical protein KDD47_09035 [Acidobacteria bacterium]|nr:hypothetical protein [Acidobacteriota bacterium]